MLNKNKKNSAKNTALAGIKVFKGGSSTWKKTAPALKKSGYDAAKDVKSILYFI